MTAHVQGGIERAAVPLAEVVRGDLVESVHAGHLVLLGADGGPVVERGDADAVIWPRSSVKPFQAVAMLRHGLALPPRLLALAAASHNGEPEHLAGVREILDGVGLDESALQNTPDMPLHPPAAFAWQLEGHGPSSITQNCSGKHAAMLATCVAAGWDTATYLDVDHPLQLAVRETVAQATGVPVEHVTVDGCGAPLFSTTVRGLARAFGRLAAAPERDPRSPEAHVARAMAAFPEMVGGTGRDATLAMRAVPGLVAKDGADGVYGAGLPDGSALAFKVLDGGSRPRPAVLAAALRRLGAPGVAGADDAALTALGDVPVLGAGRPVGSVRRGARRGAARVRAVVQRVSRASVSVVAEDGSSEVVGAIDRPGLLALVGVTHDDGDAQVETIARKIAELRILAGERSVQDEGAPVLVVSQFTLYADTKKGRRPSWNGAAPGPVAEPLVDAVVSQLRERGIDVATGRFGAHMAVELVNDGPVTLILEA